MTRCIRARRRPVLDLLACCLVPTLAVFAAPADAAIRHTQVFMPTGDVPAAPAGVRAPGATDRVAVRVDRGAIARAVRSGRLELPSTDGSVLVARDLRVRERDDGLQVIFGRVETGFGLESVVLTLGPDVAFGTIPQRSGPALRLETRRGVTALVEGGGDLPAFADPEPDFALPPLPDAAARAQRREQEAKAAGVEGPAAAGDPVIDVVVAYTPMLVQVWGSVAAVHARIAHLEEISNQSYIDSNVGQSIRVVARHLIDYSVNNDNDDALYAITGSAAGTSESSPVRQEVLRLRSLYGADLVKVMRNFDRSTQTSCGVGWLGGYSGNPFTTTWGFSVTSDYGFANDNCGEWTFTHELGHNMGSHHDVETAGGDTGAFAYSHGLRMTLSASEGFATIMAYNTGPQVRIGRWSNPLQNDCMGQPCGNAADADNVRSLNNTRALVAAITPALGATSLPEVSISDVIVAEGNSGQRDANFVISLSKTSASPVTVTVATMSGSAAAITDYVPQSTTVTIPAGQTSVVFPVKVNGDTDPEVDEYFALNAISATNARILDGQGVATISNDDATPTLSVSDASIDEGNSGKRNLQFVVRLTAASTMPVYFDFHTHAYGAGPLAATAGVDFDHVDLTNVMIPAGATSTLVSVPITGDTAVEEEERFYILVNNVRGAAVGDVFAVGRIRNDDGVARPTIAISGGNFAEGNSGSRTVLLNVALSAPATETVLFTAVSSNGTATAGQDYEQLANDGVIGVGQSGATVPVVIRGDTTVEPDETFTVALINIAGATLSGGAATVRIDNDDSSEPDPPLVARDDHAVVLENSPGTTIAVLDNDILTASRFTTGSLTVNVPAQHGTVTVDTRSTANASDDRLVYKPNANVSLDDRFGYRLCESGGRCVNGIVTVVVRPHAGITVGSDTGAGFVDVTLSGMRAMPDARISAVGLDDGNSLAVQLGADPTPDDPWDGSQGTSVLFHPVEPGFRRLIAEVRSLSGGNVDLYIGADDDNDFTAEANEVRCTSATDAPLEHCEFEVKPGDQRLWVMVHSRGPAQEVLREGWIYNVDAVADEHAIAATGPGQLAAGASFPVRVSWNTSRQPAEWGPMYAMLKIGNAGDSPALVPIRIERPQVLSTPHALGAKAVEVAVAAGGVQDRLYVDVPAGASGLKLTLQGAGLLVDLVARRVGDGWSSPAITPAPVTGLEQFRWDDRAEGFTTTLTNPTPGRWYIVIENDQAREQSLSISAEVIGSGIAPAPRGSWFNPDRGGHGLILYPAGTEWAGLWYTYLQDGTSTWYYLQGPAPTGNGVWQGGIYRAAWNGSSNYLTPVGEAIVTPVAGGMVYSYRLDGESGSERMEPLGWGCPTLAGSPLDVSSHWFNPARAGTGYSVQMWENYEFYAAFVYDGRGVPRFLTAEAAPFAGADAVIKLEQLHGFCPLCARPGAPQRFDVGNLRRRFAAGTFAEIELDALWTDGVPGVWTADEAIIPLGGPDSLQGCQP